MYKNKIILLPPLSALYLSLSLLFLTYYLQNISNLCLGYINETSLEWVCESNITLVDGVLVGYPSHFTKFAVLVGSVSAPKVNDPGDVTQLRNIDKSTISVCIL